MPRLQIGNFWDILRQVNVSEIHTEADRRVDIVIAGPPGGPAGRLTEVLRSDEVTSTEQPASVIRTAGPSRDARGVAGATLVVAVDPERQAKALVKDQVPVIAVSTGVTQPPTVMPSFVQVALPAVDRRTVEEILAPVIVQQLDDSALAAARRLPALRRAYGEWLINETSRANALYALSTGVAEAVPALNIPLNIADLVVLTKNQLVLVYKLALAAGRPKSPVSVIRELVSVIGAGFMWRQIARELVGLVPVIGIVPKVAVAYGGTYAVGQAAQTYLIEGQVPAGDQLKALYAEAVDRGRTLAQTLARRNEKNAAQPANEPTNQQTN